MISCRKFIATAIVCAAGLLLSFSEAAIADGPGNLRRPLRPRARRAAHKQKPRVSALQPAAVQPQVGIIDEAGIKRLLTRGAPPQDRPLLVNFWATWCDPCREEFPDLVRIDADYRSKGLDFVALSLDDLADIKTKVPEFLRSQRATMPVFLLDVPDPETIIRLVDTTWQGDMPATFLYDQSGKIVYKHKGPIKPAELRAEIDKVLGGK